MKIISFMIVFLLFTGGVLSQKSLEIKEEYQNQSVIRAAANVYESSEVSISWTIGDAVMILIIDDEGSSAEMDEVDFTISTYPNPSIERLYISHNSQENETLTITIYDLFGRQLIKEQLFNNQNEINVQKLPSALYAVIITNATGQLVKTFKIIKN